MSQKKKLRLGIINLRCTLSGYTAASHQVAAAETHCLYLKGALMSAIFINTQWMWRRLAFLHFLTTICHQVAFNMQITMSPLLQVHSTLIKQPQFHADTLMCFNLCSHLCKTCMISAKPQIPHVSRTGLRLFEVCT